MEITGKTALITGASSGIGKACAEILAQNGVNVIVTARRLDRLEELARALSSKGVTITPFQLDVQNQQEVEELFKKLESAKIEVDILINNAGLALALDKIQEGDCRKWDTMIDTNIKGLLYMTRSALPGMIKRNKGHIINIGSVAGHNTYVAGNVYSATKFAVKSLTQSFRLDLLGTAIRVSEVDPGAVETEFSEIRFNDKHRAKNVYAGFQPLLAEDIADGVFYCLSRPPHVNISELVIYPQAQASVSNTYKI